MKDRPNLEVGETTLSRDLGEFDITMIGVGAMIGAGIFVLTGAAAGAAGPALLLSFALNAVVTLFTAMVYAELGSAIPEAGGGYLWVKDSLGSTQGFLAGWMSWFSHSVAGALYALGFGSYFALLLRSLGMPVGGFAHDLLAKGLGVAVVLLFLFINFRGTSETGMAGNVVTLAKLFVIGLFVAAGIYAISVRPQAMEHFRPFFPKGWSAVFIAMGFTYVAFEGYEIIVQAGEEVKNPRRSIPRAVFWSLIIVVPVYILVGFAALGAVRSPGPSWKFLGQYGELGLVKAAGQFMPLGTFVLLAGGLLSTVSALNATTFSSTRVAFAMGRDRVLPEAFAKVHSRNKTPYVALAATGVIMLLMVVLVPIDDVATAADVMFLLLFVQVNYAVLRIRREFGDRLEYGYMMPLYPWVPIVGMFLQAGLAVYLFRYSAKAWFLAGGWVAVGVGVFVAYVRGRVEKEEKPRIARRRIHRAAPGAKAEILVGVSTPELSHTQMVLASALARARNKELLAVKVLQVPRQTPLRGAEALPLGAERVLDELEAFAEEANVTVRAQLAVGRAVSETLAEVARRTEASAIVLGWHGQVYERRIRGSIADAVLRNAPVDVLVVKDRGLPEAGVKRVTAALAPGSEERVGLGAAVQLARGLPASLRVVSVCTEDRIGEWDEWRESVRRDALDRGLDPDGYEFELRTAESFADVLVEEADEADVFVMGAARDWVDSGHLLGRIPDTVANRTRTTVMVVKREEARVVSLLRRVKHWIGRGE